MSERKKRNYRLSPAGREILRAACIAVRPWRFTTGPKTDEGKTRAKYNAWKDGRRSRVRRLERRCARLRKAIHQAASSQQRRQLGDELIEARRELQDERERVRQALGPVGQTTTKCR